MSKRKCLLESFLSVTQIEIFRSLILRNHRTWTWKISDCLTGLGLTLWYIGLGPEGYLNYITLMELVLWYIRLKKYSVYLSGIGLILILDLDLKNTWTDLLDADWYYYNQAGILLEKYENLLGLFVKQLVVQSNLACSISQGQTKLGV